MPSAGPPPLGEQDRTEVEQFLFREARLLDERRWDDWLALWAEGATYRIPTRSTPEPDHGDRTWSVDGELTPADGIWWVDETKEVMAFRIAKLHTGKAWAEDPPSRTRRFVTNVEVTVVADRRFAVRSNVLVYRGRRQTDVELFAAARADVLERNDHGLVITARDVTLDVHVLTAANLVLFF